MEPVRRPAPFVLVSTGHGSMIVAHTDYRMVDGDKGFGVGFQLLSTSLFDPDEVGLALQMLHLRRTHFGDGVQALDCGANIGVHTIEWARAMTGWGAVIGIEAQERLYYALAGNVALNNCMNAKVVHAAVGGEVGGIDIPILNYAVPSSFGSFEIKKRAGGTEFIGQDVNYESGAKTSVNLVTIDSLGFRRLDFIKLDVEGMEMEALQGAAQTLKACKPQLLVEVIKAQPGSVQAFLTGLGYQLFPAGINILAVHQDDPSLANITRMPKS
jgi:FkbM family methyltransferase